MSEVTLTAAFSTVPAGVIMYPWQQARDVFHAHNELAPTMPDELTVQIGMVAGPDGHSVVYLAPVWSTSADPSAGSLHPLGATSRDADAHPAVVQRRRDRRAARACQNSR